MNFSLTFHPYLHSATIVSFLSNTIGEQFHPSYNANDPSFPNNNLFTLYETTSDWYNIPNKVLNVPYLWIFVQPPIPNILLYVLCCNDWGFTFR